MTDITLLTCRAYYKPDNITPYIQNILLEQELLKSAFESQGLKVDITYWDNPSYEWQKTKSVLFRTVWDCLLYTSPSPRDYAASRMPSSA